MVQREKSSPPKRPVRRPLAEQSRHHHRPHPLEGSHPHPHHYRLQIQTKGATLSAALRLLRLPAGRRQMMLIGRTFQLKTNERFLHGLTSFLPVTLMDPYLLPPHPLIPSPQTVRVITHPRRRPHRDPRHHFLTVGSIPERVRIRASTFKTR